VRRSTGKTAGEIVIEGHAPAGLEQSQRAYLRVRVESAARVAGGDGALPDADGEFDPVAVQRRRQGERVGLELIAPIGLGAHDAVGADELAVGVDFGRAVDVPDVDPQRLGGRGQLEAQPIPGVTRVAAESLVRPELVRTEQRPGGVVEVGGGPLRIVADVKSPLRGDASDALSGLRGVEGLSGERWVSRECDKKQDAGPTHVPPRRERE
jgi:hypothetical protein